MDSQFHSSLSSILQWNINGLKSNRNELKHLIHHYNPFCITLNETRIINQQIIAEKSYRNYTAFSDPNRNNLGNLILIRKDINFIPLTLDTVLNAIAIEIDKEDQKVRICSLYLSPNIPINLLDIEKLIKQLSPHNSPCSFLILGDFNARSEYWFDIINNDRGNKILDSILQFDLEVLNTDSPTHFNFTHRCQTNIDLSLCTKDLAPELYWYAHQDLCGSDHYPILIHFLNFTSKINKFRWKFQQANWPLFTYTTSHIKFNHDLSCSSNLTNFMQEVISIGKKCIPFSESFSLTTCNPWWNQDCKIAKQNKNKARRRYLATKDPIDLIQFKRFKAIARKVYNNAQRESWKTYVSSINSETPIKQIWNRVNKLRGKYKGAHTPSLNLNGLILNNPTKVANCLGETLSNASKGLANISPPFAMKKKIEESIPIDFTSGDPQSYNNPFSMEELQAALSECSNSSPGEDLISTVMIKHLHNEALNTLLTIYNSIWSSGYFPTEWRDAVILPFLKPGKDPFLPQNYRPIALTSCLCKLMERMVNFRLMWLLEYHGLLSTHQYGFRKNKSTLDPLTLLENDIGKAFSQQKFVTAVFFDVEKAYDTVWRHHILKVLKQKGLKGNLPIFIKNFISPRHFTINLNGHTSDKFCQHEGVPQGSVLSTTCFILAIDGIVKDLPINVQNSLYVDDLAIWITGERKNYHIIQRELQTAINNIQFFCNINGFKISESKTVAISFYKGRNIPSLKLKIGPTSITFATQVKFLGIYLDQKLTWEYHIKNLKKNCRSALNLLKSLTHTRWGADRNSLLYLHSSLILSRLDYASHLYMAATESRLKLLDPIHNEGLRIATGAFRSSRIQSLYVESNSPPLKFRRVEYSLNYYSRILYANSRISRIINSTKNITLKRYFPFTSSIHNLLQLYKIPELHIIKHDHLHNEPWNLHSPQICINEPGIKKKDAPSSVLFQIFSEHQETHQTTTKLYTDGSKSLSGVGYGVVLPSYSIRGLLPSNASVFSAELTAIHRALLEIIPQKNKISTIFTDSLSSLECIKSLKPSHPLASKIRQTIHTLSLKKHKISLCWCPSHIGIKGNEDADSLAKSVVDSTSRISDKTFHKDYKEVFKQRIREKWQQEWNIHINNISEHNVLEIIKPEIKFWPSAYSSSRFEEVLFCRLRHGHTKATHGHLMSQSPRAVCDICQTPISVPHILIDCPKFSNQRKIFGNNPSLKSILQEDSISKPKVLKFLKDIDFLNKI